MALFNRKPTRGNTDIAPEFRPLIEAGAEVYNQLGSGFEAMHYADAMVVELDSRNISAQTNPEYTLKYKGQALPTPWIPALLINGEIAVDIVVEDLLSPAVEQRVAHCLKMADCPKGILFNFGSQGFQYRRYVAMEQ